MKTAGFLKLAIIIAAFIMLSPACGGSKKAAAPKVPTAHIDSQERKFLQDMEKTREEYRTKKQLDD